MAIKRDKAPRDLLALLERPTCSVTEAGQIIGLGRAAAYRAAERGDLPTIKIGRRLMVPTAGLRRLLMIEDAL